MIDYHFIIHTAPLAVYRFTSPFFLVTLLERAEPQAGVSPLRRSAPGNIRGSLISSLRFRAPIPLAEVPPPIPLGQSGGEARLGGVALRGKPRVPSYRFSKFSDNHFITVMSRAVVDSTCRIRRNLIPQTAEAYRTTPAFSRKEQGSNT